MTKSLNIVHQAILSKLVRTWAAGHHHHQGDGEIDARRLVDAFSIITIIIIFIIVIIHHHPRMRSMRKALSSSSQWDRCEKAGGRQQQARPGHDTQGEKSIWEGAQIFGKLVNWDILRKTHRWWDFGKHIDWKHFREAHQVGDCRKNRAMERFSGNTAMGRF